MPSSGFCRTTISYQHLGGQVLPDAAHLGVGLEGLGIALHMALWVIAPLNLLSWLNIHRRHNPLGLLVAGPGAVFIVMVVTSHWLDAIPHDLIWPGLVVIAAGVLIDWHAQWQRRSLLRTG